MLVFNLGMKSKTIVLSSSFLCIVIFLVLWYLHQIKQNDERESYISQLREKLEKEKELKNSFEIELKKKQKQLNDTLELSNYHQKQINQLHLKTEKLFLKSIESKFDELYDKFIDNYYQIQNNTIIHNNKLIQFRNEIKYVYQYNYDKITDNDNDNDSDKNTLNIVMIGQSGYGKSTFGNRLCGDVSKYGNQTLCFKTSNHINGCTKNTEKKIIKGLYPNTTLSVIDTAGLIFDANHNDNIKDLIKTLKGSGGINAFLIFIRDRFDQNQQYLLKNMTNIFGTEFWKNIIFITTGINGLHKIILKNIKLNLIKN